MSFEECGKYNETCVPFDRSPKGEPMGLPCRGLDCGAWVCSKHAKFIDVKLKGKKIKAAFCRNCVVTGNTMKELNEREK